MKSVPPQRRKALGRGLDSLLAKRPSAPDVEKPEPGDLVRLIPVDAVDPNPHQPRAVFRPEAIEELSASIRRDGVIQPILARPEGERYLLVAGERRLRAAKHAGLTEIPAIIRRMDDDRLLEIALVENIQREDLNPIEVAHGLQKMARALELSHEELAVRTGKDRTTITNLLRLLRLPSDIQDLVALDRLSMGHARALLSLPDEDRQRQVAERVLKSGLSVRQVEQIVRDWQEPKEPKAQPPADPNVVAAVEEMERALGARVRLVAKSSRRGRIEIEYSSPEELDRIYGLITGAE